MKSKISFFSKGLFMSNLRRFWPIALVYFIIDMSGFPIRLYSDWYSSHSYYASNPDKLEFYLVEHLSWGVGSRAAILTGIIVMIIMFAYLYSGRTAYMMSAFPVSRTTCFITGVVSAVTLITVPLVVETLFCLAVCLSIGTAYISYLLFYFWTQFAAQILFLGMGALSALVAGNRLGAVGVYGVLNLLANAMLSLFYQAMNVCYLGYSTNQEIPAYNIILCPMTYIGNHVSVKVSYDAYGEVMAHSAQGGVLMLGYFVVGLVMLALSWYAYKRRRMESAGDLISFGWIKVLLQIIVSAVGSLFVGSTVAVSLWENHVLPQAQCFLLMLVITLALGAIGFYIFEMISQRTFRVFKMKVGVICMVYSAVMAISLIVVKADPTGFVNDVPRAEDVSWAGMASGYSYIYGSDGAKKDEILAYHKMLLDNKNVLANLTDTDAVETDYIQIKYILKDGTKVWRSYAILNKDEAKDIINKTAQFYNDPEKILEGLIAKNWEAFRPVNVDYFKTTDGIDAENGYNTEYVTVRDKVELMKLYQAVIADIKAGHYNAYDLSGYERYANCLDFSLEADEKCISSSDDFYDYDPYPNENVYLDDIINEPEKFDTYFSIHVCDEMTETIKALKDTGLIESENELKYDWQLYGDENEPMPIARDYTMMY